MKGEQVGEFDLSEDLLVFDKGQQAMHDAVVAYLAHQRAGTASTLNKGEVAGSNRKPWRQKGTGRARAGFRQSPVWRGGGVVFGPKPRKYSKRMPRKVARLALRRAFSEKVAAGAVVVLDELKMAEPRTREFAAMVKALEADRGVLFVVDQVGSNERLASRNLQRVELASAREVNTYQLVRYPMIVLTRSGIEEFQGRLQAPVRRSA
jgi:large subunit ribosomal protein L4